jgi:hypothetical protein
MNFHDFFAEIIEIAEPDGGFGVALATFAPSAPPDTAPNSFKTALFVPIPIV